MMMSDMSDDNFDGCDAEVGFQMGAKYRVQENGDDDAEFDYGDGGDEDDDDDGGDGDDDDDKAGCGGWVLAVRWVPNTGSKRSGATQGACQCQ